MTRRDFLIRSVAGTAASSFRLPLARGGGYSGPLFVFVQAEGGWDPTSFCDPKTNLPGEKVINRWAESGEIRQAGNIRYAPFAANTEFFERYHRRMLVINGVDAQTNSHDAGIEHNWSGTIADGYPTTTSLLAAHSGASLSMPYLSFGGFSHPAGLVAYSRLEGSDLIHSILAPTATRDVGSGSSVDSADLKALRESRAASARLVSSASGVLPMASRRRKEYTSAVSVPSMAGLDGYSALLLEADALEPVDEHGPLSSSLRRQAQLAVLAFESGVSVSADLCLGGFDTHQDHDAEHSWLLGNLTGAVDFLWNYAEERGIADRLIVVMGSDFGRTNRYNDANGKDHWPIGSFVVMQKGQRWTNRVVGETDALHFAHQIHPRSLERLDTDEGIRLHPRHVHKALRRLLEIEHSEGSRRFPFLGTEDIPLFV